ncbi:thiol-disulfide oxidoreductase DCC family protein [Robertkochia solimangrovi]|uniref:thiol-disulfide oxidoreductase DCC family protein n=1 Tax=Robertkochia solimangrovi TaxID=2213046 RepID=UPI0011812F31|nr:thiol-disulfide oxidoreductase DCC family protein [Robertkochia solimangrovi]TRZ45258.1 thiol-disulfide oxidoreductase [Robertkochia solimangrovi]
MDLPENKKIILFDGVCNLCNGAVNYVIKRDKKDVFRFASLQGEFGKKFLTERGLDSEELDSIVVYEPGVAYYKKADAATEIAKEIGGGWQILGLFNYILPPVFRNGIYDFIARNRYRWFGRKDQCMIPTPELRSKFLEA